MAALLPLGRVVATPGALEVLAHAGTDPAQLLGRHQAGDWGEVPPEDARENRFSLRHGLRILGSYELAGERVWPHHRGRQVLDVHPPAVRILSSAWGERGGRG